MLRRILSRISRPLRAAHSRLLGMRAASDPAAVFRKIHKKNLWEDKESRSGPGSTLAYAQGIRQTLPTLFTELKIRSMLDVPCGDFNWLRDLPLPIEKYIGGDIVDALVQQNKKKYASPAREFQVIDLTKDPLPSCDILLCRDCLMHLPFALIDQAIANVLRSQIEYVLFTTYPGGVNREIAIGSFFEINLMQAPFNFPPPQKALEDWIPPFAPRHLSLWRVDDLRRHLAAKTPR